ncbi:MAG: gephyrin-like molybdotransferase Glp [Candidatus Sumerlaeota bacterium]
MLTYAQALERILALEFDVKVERVALLEARGRVLAQEITAPWPLPRFDHATMDGFAVQSADLQGASVDAPVALPIIGESAAGHPFVGAVMPQTAIRISTGAPVPAGLDAVVPIERVSVVIDSIATTMPVQVGASILRRGTNATRGATLVPAGTILSPTNIATLASFNVGEVKVYRRPRVAILTSGDEVRAVGEVVGESHVVDCATPYLLLELEACGCEARSFGISPDNIDAYRYLYANAISWADVVITTAGVSVGPHDIVGKVLESLGTQIVLSKVSVRPGKPMLVARVNGKIHFGLPGNPLSALCNTEIFVKPFLRKVFGVRPSVPPMERVKVATPFQPDRLRLFFIHSVLSVENGVRIVRPLPNQNSANTPNAAMANAFIVMQPGDKIIEEGTLVDVYPITQGL